MDELGQQVAHVCRDFVIARQLLGEQIGEQPP
jgi:hypothetical protein